MINLLIEDPNEIPYLPSFVQSEYPNNASVSIYGIEHTLLEVLCAALGYQYYPNQYADHYADKSSLGKLENWIVEGQLESIEDVPTPPEVLKPPLLSIVLPAYNPIYLDKAMDSVIRQTYSNWELIIVDDGSSKKIEVPTDSRIQLVTLPNNQGVSAATNVAIGLSKGSYIVFLDHDDYLHPYCLAYVAAASLAQPDFIFSERIRVDEDDNLIGTPTKTDWLATDLGGGFTASHVRAYPKKIFDKVGGFDSNFDGTQDYEWMLRALPLINKVQKIPHCLYYWRLHQNNQSASAKSLERIQKAKDLYFPKPKEFVPKKGKPLKKQPLVSIVIPTSYKGGYVVEALQSIKDLTTYNNYEIILVDGGEQPLELPIEVNKVSCLKPFNFSERCNIGAEITQGQYLVFLNDDTRVLTPTWLDDLLYLVRDPRVKIAAPQLVYWGSNKIQVSSVMIHSWGPIEYREPTFEFSESDSVCAACFMVRKKDFPGFSLDFPNNYNDVDLGLRIKENGKIIYTSTVQVEHRSFASRTPAEENDKLELQYFWSKWYGQIFR